MSVEKCSEFWERFILVVTRVGKHRAVASL